MHILFDIGGSKMRVAGTNNLREFSGEPQVVDTPTEFDDGIALLKKLILDTANGEDIEEIAGCASGPFDQKAGVLMGGPNLPQWIGRPLRNELEKACGAEVRIENDAALVGLGEMHFGAGEKTGVAAYLTVSTGVGGARFVDGMIDQSASGFEPGHQIVDADKTLCPDCEDGTLEALIGGAATERRMGKKPYAIKEQSFWDYYAKILAYGLNNTIVYWSPNVVVLGGSMIIGDPAISVSQVEKYVREMTHIFPTIPDIRQATLGHFGGLYGAMALLGQR